MALLASLARLCGIWVAWLDGSTPPSPPPADAIAEIDRLEGHRVAIAPDGTGYEIESVAGEGKPVVGVVERRGEHLMLVSREGEVYRLAGVLARPRIAGPGYKVWVLGELRGQAPARTLVARRLGILAPPAETARAQARDARSTMRAISAGAPRRSGGPQ